MKSYLLQRLLLRTARLSKKTGGFTLLELLVSALMAAIIVTTLITFATSILETDRKEQAKVTTQEEIQAALDYIADDMQEAVYVYDAAGIAEITTGTNRLPTGTDKTPVLVFWKRVLLDGDAQVKSALTNTDIQVKCLGVTSPNPCNGRDQFVYSLVAYYLVKDSSSTWSKSARIARWEVKDGIVDPTCTAAPCTFSAQRSDGYETTDTSFYYVKPDPGFVRFDLSAQPTTLSGKMNLWKKSSAASAIAFATPNFETLVDFIDDTPYDGSGAPQIPIRANDVALNATTTGNLDCENNNAEAKGSTGLGSVRVPAKFDDTTINPTRLTSFYICVNSRFERPVAKVYIRGNALARLAEDPSLRPLGNANNNTFIPTANTLVFGRSVIVPQ